MTDNKIETSKSIYYSLTDDVPDLTEEEKMKLEAVIKKAQEFEEEEANKLRQPLEGQLYKYTNVMKGWQYRWFVLTPDTGMFEYYMLDEKKKSRPRGGLHLAGAVVIPSDEDNQSFTVSAVCGEVFKLKASDAKERQYWVDRIRNVIEKCSAEDPVASLKADVDLAFALCKSNSCSRSSTFHVEENTIPQASPTHPVPEKSKTTSAGKTSIEEINEIKDAVYKAVACQKTLAKSIEDLPSSGPSLRCSDRNLLLIKATSQATVQSLEQCFLILQKLRQRELARSMITSITCCDPTDKSKHSISESIFFH